MVMRVWVRNSEGKPYVAGDIRLVEGVLVAEAPVHPSVTEVLSRDAFVAGERISPQLDPEGWMKAAPQAYRGTYLWIEEIVEEDLVKEGVSVQ